MDALNEMVIANPNKIVHAERNEDKRVKKSKKKTSLVIKNDVVSVFSSVRRRR
jgi:hypothetical protein